jgi:hypothetical protein
MEGASSRPRGCRGKIPSEINTTPPGTVRTDVKRSPLIAWLVVLGAALWLSSMAVAAHPAYAGVAVLAVLVWSMGVVARPSRN